MSDEISALPMLGELSVQGAASLGDAVHATLRDRIAEGILLPGTRLREVELAKALGVSRTPVREALKRLESDGLMSYQAGRGAIVTELTPSQANELYELRAILEGAAARFAAQHASNVEIEALQRILEQQRKASDDPAEQAKLNRRFHKAIYDMAHNRYLLDVLIKAQDYLVLLRRTAYLMPGRAGTAHEEHRAVVDAIAKRDSDAAEAAARNHIREAQRVRLALEFGDQ